MHPCTSVASGRKLSVACCFCVPHVPRAPRPAHAAAPPGSQSHGSHSQCMWITLAANDTLSRWTPSPAPPPRTHTHARTRRHTPWTDSRTRMYTTPPRQTSACTYMQLGRPTHWAALLMAPSEAHVPPCRVGAGWGSTAAYKAEHRHSCRRIHALCDGHQQMDRARTSNGVGWRQPSGKAFKNCSCAIRKEIAVIIAQAAGWVSGKQRSACSSHRYPVTRSRGRRCSGSPKKGRQGGR